MRASPAPAPHAPPACGARVKRGTGRCKQPAGSRTDHPGQGRCWLHGGATPIKHGRYSSITRPRLRELVDVQNNDPAPLDTHPEIALVRAMLIDYVERYDAFTEALIGWHESFRAGLVPLAPAKVLALRAVLAEYEELGQGGEGLTEKQAADLQLARECVDRLEAGAGDVGGKPHQVLDLADAYRMAGEVTKMVERVERARSASAITRPELERLLLAMGRVVEAYVPDVAVRTRITEAWLALQV